MLTAVQRNNTRIAREKKFSLKQKKQRRTSQGPKHNQPFTTKNIPSVPSN